jgi:integrase/recombinase XerD
MQKDLDQLFDEFIYESEYGRKVRKETLRGYQSTFKLFRKIVPTGSLQNLDANTLIHFFKTLHERERIVGKGIHKTGVKKSTLASYWSKLNCFFKWLKTNKHIKSNPFELLSYPTPSYEDRKFLKKEEIEKIITAIHNHHDNNLIILKRNLVLFYIFLFCGLRKEEAMLLQIRDIDFERRSLTIRGDTSKSGRSREIPLHSTLVMHLKDYLAIRKGYNTQYLIVSSRHDERFSNAGLKHLVQNMRGYSGVNFHLHQFRHTFAVNFLKSSNNIAKLKQLLGHKSISMTLSYLRCLPTDELRSDIEGMSIDKLI